MPDYAALKRELDECKNPLFFFHDDTDGLCSFLQFYKYKKEGHWTIVKSRPLLDDRFFGKVEEYDPDKIFVFDVAEVDQGFIDKAKRPIIWVDHHEPLDRERVSYFNPRKDTPARNIPTTLLCYNTLQDDTIAPAIMWIAMVGSIADWHMPAWKEEFCARYPQLLDKHVTKPEVALFDQPVGKLARILQFLTKGPIKDVKRNILTLLKIREPIELLEQTTGEGAFLFKRYKATEKEYLELWKDLQAKKTKDPLLVFAYTENKTSFTGELATEAIYRHPEKLVIICREKSGEMRCSLRSARQEVLPMLKKALIGIQGYGGGHEYACGAAIQRDDFARFLENLREQLK
ncbi:hypothetical protein HY639_02360 [Candidatus Woesearchaeota archaeon]|nr:hypothetical protein [Candidatus Woesearchaeota archaeon]